MISLGCVFVFVSVTLCTPMYCDKILSIVLGKFSIRLA